MSEFIKYNKELEELSRLIRKAWSGSRDMTVSLDWILEQMLLQLETDLAEPMKGKSSKGFTSKLLKTKEKVLGWKKRYGELRALVSSVKVGGGSSGEEGITSAREIKSESYRFCGSGKTPFHKIGKSDEIGLTNRSFAIMCWIFIENFNSIKDQQLDNAIIGQNTGGTNSQLHLVVRDKKLHFGFYGNDSSSSTVLEEQSWHHVCFSYDKETKAQSIYVNCKLDNKSEGKHEPLQGSSDVFISQYSNGRCLDGSIADLKIIPKALKSNDDVFFHMQNSELYPLSATESVEKTHPVYVSMLDSIKSQANKYGYIRMPGIYMKEEGVPEETCLYCACTFESGDEFVDYCPVHTTCVVSSSSSSASSSASSGATRHLCHKDCMNELLENSIKSGFVGKCPQVLCPAGSKHSEWPPNKIPLLNYRKWSKLVSSTSLQKYKSFAEGYLIFLCGSCHTSKSQMVPYDERFKGQGLEGTGIQNHLMDLYLGYAFGPELEGGLETSYEVGARVVLARGYESVSDAASGPLKPGDVGIVVEAGSSPKVKLADGESSREWYYSNKALAREPKVKSPIDEWKPKANTTPIPNLDAFAQSLVNYELGKISAAEFYSELFTVHAPKLNPSTNAADSWILIKRIASMIVDPDRRSAFQMYHWSRHPKFDTICCNRTHCFRCKTKDFHTGKSCDSNIESIDSSLLPCPKCFVYLVKSDGCDSITCVCGHKFNWPAELKKFNEANKFLKRFPTNTSEICADILCGVEEAIISSESSASTASGGGGGGKGLTIDNTEFTALQETALIWRQHNQPSVDALVLAAWRRRFPMNADQVIAKIRLESGLSKKLKVHSCVNDIWYAANRAKVDKILKELQLCNDSLLNSLYPTIIDKYNALSYLSYANLPDDKTWFIQTSLHSSSSELNARVDWVDDAGNVMFHFNPRGRESQLVMNVYEEGRWQSNEERIPLPADVINGKSPLVASVCMTSKCFEVRFSRNIQSKAVHSFNHRLPVERFVKVTEAPPGWTVTNCASAPKPSADDVFMLEKLQNYKKDHKTEFAELEKDMKTKTALMFLRLFGNDKISTSYNYTTKLESALSYCSEPQAFKVGDRVLLSEDYARYDDAAQGPLKKGDVGTIVTDASGHSRGTRVKVIFNGREWWYDLPALVIEGYDPLTVLSNPIYLEEREDEIIKFYSLSVGKGSPAADTEWSCSACTFLNHSELKKCEICETARPQSDSSSNEIPISFTDFLAKREKRRKENSVNFSFSSVYDSLFAAHNGRCINAFQASLYAEFRTLIKSILKSHVDEKTRVIIEKELGIATEGGGGIDSKAATSPSAVVVDGSDVDPYDVLTGFNYICQKTWKSFVFDLISRKRSDYLIPVTNSLAPGDRVELSPDYANFTDASSGPLKPGEIGIVKSVSTKSCSVQAPNGRSWWYQFGALMVYVK